MAILKNNGNICFLCGLPMIARSSKKNPMALEVTLEHIKARSKGGTSKEKNLAVAHYYCNKKRSSRDLSENLLWALRKAVRRMIEQRTSAGKKFAKPRIEPAAVGLGRLMRLED